MAKLELSIAQGKIDELERELNFMQNSKQLVEETARKKLDKVRVELFELRR